MANNKTNTSILYEQRRYYKYSFFNYIENKIDFWELQKYYGRVDKRGIPFYLNQQYLKSITTPSITNTQQKQMVLNIVSDSFKEMNDEFKKADLYFNIPKSKYNPLKIKKSTLVFETEYTNYFRELLNLWYKQNKNNIDNNISNFNNFMNLFIGTFAYANAIMTQSAYLTSFLSSPLNTGLVIEISNDKHDEDPTKINSYINDENFEFFCNTTGKYGFMVDKNAPWRIVYNLTTQYANEKLNQYGITDIDDLFGKYYVYPHLTEYKKLREEFINFYNSKVKQKPTLQKSEYCHITKGVKFTEITKSTEIIQDDLSWIKFYYFLRCKEETIGMTQSQFVIDLNKISMLYNSFGETSALEWILNKTKKFIDGGSNPSYTQYTAVTTNKSQNLTLYNFQF